MMKKIANLALAALVLSCCGGPARAQEKAASGPVVLEMFTSQGCSSCPPAETYLAEMAKRPDIIALGCHVDYWDYLNWKDTYSRPFCTVRQKAYRTAMKTKHIYTPQIVVNGSEGLNGTDRAAVEQAMAQSPPVLPVGLTRTEKGALRIALPALGEQVPDGTTLYLYQYGKSLDLPVRSGENRGQSVMNANPVLLLKPLGAWDGAAKTMETDIPLPGAALAVIVNRETLGPVVAAGRLDAP